MIDDPSPFASMIAGPSLWICSAMRR